MAKLKVECIMKNLKKASKKKIRKVEKMVQNLPVSPQTFVYLDIYEAAIQLYFQNKYNTVCKICDALLN